MRLVDDGAGEIDRSRFRTLVRMRTPLDIIMHGRLANTEFAGSVLVTFRLLEDQVTRHLTHHAAKLDQMLKREMSASEVLTDHEDDRSPFIRGGQHAAGKITAQMILSGCCDTRFAYQQARPASQHP
jgi:hypothetical protein